MKLTYNTGHGPSVLQHERRALRDEGLGKRYDVCDGTYSWRRISGNDVSLRISDDPLLRYVRCFGYEVVVLRRGDHQSYWASYHEPLVQADVLEDKFDAVLINS